MIGVWNKHKNALGKQQKFICQLFNKSHMQSNEQKVGEEITDQLG